MLDKYRDLCAEDLEKRVMKDLVSDAAYAIRSNNGDAVNDTYGMAKMAHSLGAISWEEFKKLNHALVSGWMNAGDKQREAYARTVRPEDISAGRNWRDA